MSQTLFTPANLGKIALQNRIVMAPMTRNRAAENGVPTELMAEHYGQRGDAGLIVAEGTWPAAPSPEPGRGAVCPPNGPAALPPRIFSKRRNPVAPFFSGCACGGAV